MRTFEDYLTACVHEAGINNFTEKLVMDFEHPSAIRSCSTSENTKS